MEHFFKKQNEESNKNEQETVIIQTLHSFPKYDGQEARKRANNTDAKVFYVALCKKINQF